MSFQGDVNGTALADLLQSMARGREGVLKLSARRSVRLSLGFLGGSLYLLPEDNEESETWRARSQDAFREGETRVDPLRMAQIARAQRIETLFTLLESGEVHFRFTPGPVPRPGEAAAAIQPGESGQSVNSGVHVAPIPVEALLLEYARLCDEGLEVPGWRWISPQLVLTALIPPKSAPEAATFLAECDGASSLAEIADRLGWPLRQARICAETLCVQGRAQSVDRATLLSLVQRELIQSNPSRAAARLGAWLRVCAPGPIASQELAVLESLATSERLAPLLARMSPQDARRLALRAGNSSATALQRVGWHAEVARACPKDRLAALHLMAAQVRSGIDPSVPSQESVLELARAFHSAKQSLRARALLRVAATRENREPQAQLELGQLLLANGAAAESTQWILEAARHFLDRRQPAVVLDALRGLCDAHSGGAEARRLLTRARALSVRSRLVQRHSLIIMGVCVLLMSVGVVHYRGSSARAQAMQQVREEFGDPARALATFEAHFAGQDDADLEELRQEIHGRMTARDLALRNAWNEQFRAIQSDCNLGDALSGLDRALKLSRPPALHVLKESWGTRADLFRGLAARMERKLTSLPEATESGVETQSVESTDRDLLRALRSRLGSEARSEDITALDAQLQALSQIMDEREQRRAARDLEAAEGARLLQQDILYNSAQSDIEQGRFDAALKIYEQLVPEFIGTGPQSRIVKERDALAATVATIRRAEELCRKGDLAAARAELGKDSKLRNQPMPLLIDSVPPGATLSLPDNSQYRCPVELRASLFQDLEFSLQLKGHAPLVHRGPAGDLRLLLEELPALQLTSRTRIEAAPLFHAGRCYLADRTGTLYCLDGDRIDWQRETGSLSGFARSPLAHPRDPSRILVASEDGEVWSVGASDGELKGPWRAPLPLRSGPEVLGDLVVVRLRDGSAWVLDENLVPAPVETPLELNAPSQAERALPTGLRLSEKRYRWDSPTGERNLGRVGTLHFAVQVGGWLYIADGAGLRMWHE